MCPFEFTLVIITLWNKITNMVCITTLWLPMQKNPAIIKFTMPTIIKPPLNEANSPVLIPWIFQDDWSRHLGGDSGYTYKQIVNYSMIKDVPILWITKIS